MQDLITKAKSKFNNLKKQEKVAVVSVLSVFAAIFFFNSGISVGEAIYGITH